MSKLFVKNGFTLVELLITISIIAALAVIAIPNFRLYGSRMEYNNKVEEVRSLYDQMIAMVQNPEKGIASYSMAVSSDTLSLTKSANSDGTGPITVKEVEVNPSLGVAFSSTSPTPIKCIVVSSTVENISCDPGSPPILTLTDTNLSTTGIATFILKYQPLSLTVTNNQ